MATTVESPAEHEVLRFFGKPAFEEWRLFEGHFELAAGSALLVLLLPGTAGALVCEQALAKRLAKYEQRLERIRFSSASEIIRLGELLLNLNLDDVGGVWVTLMSPGQADEAWITACGKMFTLLNMHRNRILKALPVPLIFVGEPWLQKVFRESAPDFWSVRSTVVRLAPQGQPDEPLLGGASLQNQQEVIGVEAASDPDYTLQQSHRLANRKELTLQRVELLMRAAAGFQKSARFELAESCWREALNILAEKSEIEQHPQSDIMRAEILNNLAIVLDKLGHREEALARAQEVTHIYENLAKARPDDFLPGLAGSLNNLATNLSDLGRCEEALARAEEAVSIREKLAKARPEAFLSDLAMSLNNLATNLNDLGRHEDAMSRAQEAVRIYGKLAKARPESFLSDLAMSLNNLALTLAALGRREEALALGQEAVEIREQLTKAHPDVSLPDLAGSLNNLAIILGALDRHEEALARLQEAVRVREQLAKARPEGFLPDLAKSYGVRGILLKTMGRHAEASISFAQGLQVITPFFQKTPTAFRQLVGTLFKAYLDTTKQAQIQPDEKLLAPVVEALEKLRTDQPNQGE